ncbi:unnamed protein product [Paramecium sonneborni]|uniref:Macro domain-containing protein n=1 Tax=Paramecium sonneborni TaxID=65129 RepID=A0A8S1QLV2_9CILI|nr:unnamed protein product [Paramecium sonneborni]
MIIKKTMIQLFLLLLMVIRARFKYNLKYQNKKIQIVYADISNVRCDAIVNSCNNKMSFGDPLQLSGVANSIFRLGGASYHQFCLDYINKYNELKIGKVVTYNMPIGRQIKNILNVATPIYSRGDEADDDLNKIKDNIEAIFKEIKNLDENLWLFQFLMEEHVDIVLIKLHNKYQILQQINLELIDVKIQKLTQILAQMLKQPDKEREIKYQWQWIEENIYKNYDDEDFNKQIDEAYELFQLTGQEQKVHLKFPYSKQPGTHMVNFNNNTVYDISLNKEKSQFLNLFLIQGSFILIKKNQMIKQMNIFCFKK